MIINPMQSAHCAPRCCAHARTTGKPCRALVMANGRCRMHGGKSTGAPTRKANAKYKHGKRTIERINERREIKALCRDAQANTQITKQFFRSFKQHVRNLGVRWEKLWSLCCLDDNGEALINLIAKRLQTSRIQ